MKDSKDIKTLDAFPVKKRGRPSTGSAMSALERKNASMAKRKEDFKKGDIPAYKECTTAYLMDYLSFLIEKKWNGPARLVAAELVSRAE